MNALPFAKKVRVVSALVEGCSIRATERMTDVNRETVMNLGVIVGEACRRLHSALMRDVQVNVLEVDEIWAYIQKKQKHLTDADPPERGDAYTYIGLDANKKAIISYRVGKRDATTTNDFITDLKDRITNRPQISSDGFVPYIEAIKAAFGPDADYAQIIKKYGEPEEQERRYSPPRCIGVERRVITGNPDWERISTSYVERDNLTIRMQVRRFTRLSNAFSKKLRNHEAAVALYAAWYNFCWIHGTLRTTPAMALDVTDHVWSVAELIDTAMQIAPEDAPRLPPARSATHAEGPELPGPQVPPGLDQPVQAETIEAEGEPSAMVQLDLIRGGAAMPVKR